MTSPASMDEWLRSHLACPRDRSKLELRHRTLTCAHGHTYPVVDGIAILLVDSAEPTHGYIEATLESVAALASPGATEAAPTTNRGEGVDPFVQEEIVRTAGNLYAPVQGRLPRYPIPELRLPDGEGRRLLDIGCNWGRWVVAAGRKGYRPIGIDPGLDAVMAARRVTSQLGIDAQFVVGDARFLPFSDQAFDVVFSYGVFQHFSKDNTRLSLAEAARVLKPGCRAYVQMPNRHGIRQYYQHWQRGFTEGVGFEIRYWTPAELMAVFEATFGATHMSVDGFFGLGIQGRDIDLLPLKYRPIVHASELLRRISRVVPALTHVADSLYLESVNQRKSSRTLA